MSQITARFTFIIWTESFNMLLLKTRANTPPTGWQRSSTSAGWARTADLWSVSARSFMFLLLQETWVRFLFAVFLLVMWPLTVLMCDSGFRGTKNQQTVVSNFQFLFFLCCSCDLNWPAAQNIIFPAASVQNWRASDYREACRWNTSDLSDILSSCCFVVHLSACEVFNLLINTNQRRMLATDKEKSKSLVSPSGVVGVSLLWCDKTFSVCGFQFYSLLLLSLFMAN